MFLENPAKFGTNPTTTLASIIKELGRFCDASHNAVKLLEYSFQAGTETCRISCLLLSLAKIVAPASFDTDRNYKIATSLAQSDVDGSPSPHQGYGSYRRDVTVTLLLKQLGYRKNDKKRISNCITYNYSPKQRYYSTFTFTRRASLWGSLVVAGNDSRLNSGSLCATHHITGAVQGRRACQYNLAKHRDRAYTRSSS